MSSEFQIPSLIMNETPMNTGDSGPYYVYSPGFQFTGLKAMVLLFNTIPGNRAFKVSSGESWSIANRLPEGSATKKRSVQNPFTGTIIEEHFARAIPAQDTLKSLIGDRSLTGLGLTQIPVFDKVNPYEDAFNLLIDPEPLEVSTYPTTNPQWKKVVEQEGMLKLRQIWAENALEGLETGRTIVDVANVIENHPYLEDIWKVALKQTILPSIGNFIVTANNRLSAIEESIRSGAQKQYDPFSSTLMWLLGRKPERTALSRTLNAAGSGQGGITPEQIKALVQETLGAMVLTQPAQPIPTKIDQIQCPDCGEYLNTVAGGPPRKCWRCSFEFMAMSTTPTLVNPNDDEIARIAEQIQNGL